MLVELTFSFDMCVLNVTPSINSRNVSYMTPRNRLSESQICDYQGLYYYSFSGDDENELCFFETPSHSGDIGVFHLKKKEYTHLSSCGGRLMISRGTEKRIRGCSGDPWMRPPGKSSAQPDTEKMLWDASVHWVLRLWRLLIFCFYQLNEPVHWYSQSALEMVSQFAKQSPAVNQHFEIIGCLANTCVLHIPLWPGFRLPFLLTG